MALWIGASVGSALLVVALIRFLFKRARQRQYEQRMAWRRGGCGGGSADPNSPPLLD
jgi:hypothetical protein